jgi:hypothetical protein
MYIKPVSSQAKSARKCQCRPRPRFSRPGRAIRAGRCCATCAKSRCPIHAGQSRTPVCATLPQSGQPPRKNLVTCREGDAFLYLNLQSGRFPQSVVRVDHDIVERMSLGGSLECDAIDGRPRQASGFRRHQHREQVSGPHLAFEAASCGSGRCWACHLRQGSSCLCGEHGKNYRRF